jgi:hypothetical protein
MGADDRLDAAAYMKTLLSLTTQSNLSLIEKAEAAHFEQAIKMHGFVALSNAFKSFLLETVKLSFMWRSA